MTEVNGLRLAYRGFITGLAASYAWLALAMALSGLLLGDSLAPLRPLAAAVSPAASSSELAFVIGLLVVQAGGGLIGICFAYFFGRFFTVRGTLLAAAPAFTLLAWALLQAGLSSLSSIPPGLAPVGVLACLGYGLLLGVGVPVRGEVVRAQSPVT
jgi:hypothetical protein